MMSRFSNIFVSILVAFSAICSDANSKTCYSYTFKFNPESFRIETLVGDSLIIYSNELATHYSESLTPAIPLVARTIGVPGTCLPSVSEVRVFSHDFMKNVKMAVRPEVFTTDGQRVFNDYVLGQSYDNQVVYPDTVCQLSMPRNMGDLSIMHFLIPPFRYDAREKRLSFVDSIQIDFDCESLVPQSLGVSEENLVSSLALDMALRTIENKTEFQSPYLRALRSLKTS